MAPRPGEERQEDDRFNGRTAVNKFGGEYKVGEPYDPKWRKRCVEAYRKLQEAEGVHRPRHGYLRIARQYNVSEKSVERWVKIWEDVGRTAPLEKGTLNLEKVTRVHVEYVRKFLELKNTAYLWELRQYMALDLEGHVEHSLLSEATIWRIVSRELDLSHKQVRRVAEQQASTENMAWRAEYIHQVLQIDKERLLFADETGVNTGSGYRKHGWARKHGHTRATVYEPKLYEPHYTALAMVSWDGVQRVHLQRGGASADDWWTFVCSCVPLFASGQYDAFIVDNNAAHRSVDDLVQTLLDQYGMRLIYLPPYSPDLNPIEEVFGKVKLVIRDERANLRVEGGIEEGVRRGFESITVDDMHGYYRYYA